MATKSQKVLDMEAAAFAGDWEKFKSFLDDNVVMRVGSRAEVRGPQGVADFMIQMFAKELAFKDLKIRGNWETEDAVIVEFDVGANRIPDHKDVIFPCLDVYRFKGEKINDWRAFAIEPTHVK
jgi:hypothetical protein